MRVASCISHGLPVRTTERMSVLPGSTVNDSDHIKRGIMNECLVYSQAIDTDYGVDDGA